MYKAVIVEDEPVMRQGLIKLLELHKHGYHLCGEAENGKEALELIGDCKPHVVITDIKMPEMDGLELIRRVKESGLREPHFIILSGYNDFEYARSAIRYGVDDYMLKPVNEDELIVLLNNIALQLAEEEHRQPPVCTKCSEHLTCEKSHEADGVIAEIVRRIRANYREPMTLKEIAKTNYLHPIYLGQLFKKTTGLHFKDYLHRVRVEEAKLLLRRSDRKVYEIADAVGYPDEEYFVNKFKKLTGKTPTQYRSEV